MTLREQIDAIVHDPTKAYDEKIKELTKLITKREADALLPEPIELPKLKEPLKPKTKGMRILHLSLHGVYYDQILQGTKKAEYRDYNDYYKQRCTYTDGGNTYLVPYDAITFYQGRMRSMTVALTDIKCSGSYFIFYLGDILYPKRG